MNKIKCTVIFLIYLILFSGCASLQTSQTLGIPSVSSQIFKETEQLLPTQENTSLPAIRVQTITPPTQISDGEMVFHNYSDFEFAFVQMIKTTGWIQQVSTKSKFDERTQTYTEWGIFEEWYRFDADGHVKEYYSWITSPEGEVEQEVYLLENGKLYNVTFNKTGQGEIATEIDFTGGFADGLKEGENALQEKVTYQGVDAWKFSYVDKQDAVLDFAKAIYFDVATGLILGKETWLLEPEGTTKLVSSAIINSFEINAEPPLDRFQQMMEKGPK